MLRSLFSGISGLRAHQTMMDVTGNNIANVNTAGFKTSQAVFEDTFNQTLKNAAAPQAGGNGGTNPAQVGLGVRVAGISTNFGQGSAQPTGKATDLMIQGDGFFQVQLNGTESLYTRAGAFAFDAQGVLVTPEGAKVQGWMADPATGDIAKDANGIPTGPLSALTLATEKLPAAVPPAAPNALQSYAILPTGEIEGSFADGSKQVMGQVALANFTNPPGLEKVGGSMYRNTANSGAPAVGPAANAGRGTVVAGTLEMSNVDLAQEFTNLIISQRGFQANSRVITTSDQILQDLVDLKR